jgi:hypothetical protein
VSARHTCTRGARTDRADVARGAPDARLARDPRGVLVVVRVVVGEDGRGAVLGPVHAPAVKVLRHRRRGEALRRATA